jgi:cyclopropane-fatty-acyl-phospholipid synthase
MLPSIQQIGNACENLFVMEDWHNFGIDYVKTLQSWYDNFTENYVHIRTYYNESFKRLWNYYLLQCIGSFKARKNQLWQIVFSKHGVPNGYISIR